MVISERSEKLPANGPEWRPQEVFLARHMLHMSIPARKFVCIRSPFFDKSPAHNYFASTN